MQDWFSTFISQYANSPVLLRLVSNMNAYLDPAADIDGFFANIMDVSTATGFGLDVWGRIVGVNRVLQVQGGKFLGFKEAGSASADPFNQSPFYSGQAATSNFALSDQAYRTLIYAKALANITDGSAAAINQILRNLFPGRGNAWVADGLDMTMTYTFAFALTPVEQAIVQQSGALPRSTGVQMNVAFQGN